MPTSFQKNLFLKLIPIFCIILDSLTNLIHINKSIHRLFLVKTNLFHNRLKIGMTTLYIKYCLCGALNIKLLISFLVET